MTSRGNPRIRSSPQLRRAGDDRPVIPPVVDPRAIEELLIDLRIKVLAIFGAGLVIASGRYLIANDEDGTVQPESGRLEGSSGTGLLPRKLRERRLSKQQIGRLFAWRRDHAELARLEVAGAPSYTVIPDPVPATTLEWCREQMTGDPQRPETGLAQRCEVIQLAAEGKIAPGTYSTTELSAEKNWHWPKQE